MTLVDTNVFVDVIHQDPVWLDWSLRELGKARARSTVLTNYVVYGPMVLPWPAWKRLLRCVRCMPVRGFCC